MNIKLDSKAFTLIELLVVVAIIGLLAGIGISTLGNALQSGRDAKRLADMQEIETALKRYYINNGKYPGPVSNYGENGSCGGWDSSSEDTDSDGKPFIEPLEDESYLETVPIDPNDPSGSCGNYAYYRYSAGSYGCDSSKGAFMVLAVKDMETSDRPHPQSQGWSCPNRNWQTEFDWVMGKFEKP